MRAKEKWRLRREGLKKEIQAHLVPRLLELGFSSTRTREGRLAWPGVAGRGPDYIRIRDGRRDGLSVVWEKRGRPHFFMFFTVGRADAPNSMGETIAGVLVPARASGFLKLIGVKERWFGRGQTPELAVALAIRSLEELNLFLLTGENSPHIEVTQVGYQLLSQPLNNSDVLNMLPMMVLWPIYVPVWLLTHAEPGSRPPPGGLPSGFSRP